jgi:hypothetical protein
MAFIKNLLVAGFAFTTLSVSAQTADEIVTKNIEAMGGAAKLATLNSVKMSGNMSVQGQDVAITMTKLNNKGVRMDIEVMGTSNYQVANTEKGSIFFPVQGMTDPKEMDAEQYKSIASQLDLQGALFNYKAKGNAVEYVGTEKVDGADAYKLKVTLKSGKVSNYFIDTKTNRVIKTVSKANVNGEEMEIETTLADYKQDANGFWFPYTTTNMQGTISFDKIESNITVDEAIFKG